jgi:hypothetical protein
MALPNTGDGVRVFNASRGHAIGGTSPGEANLIAFNLQDGVEIDGALALRNAIRRNRITANAMRGIRLGAGANGGIAAPVIATASLARVTGSACASCLVEVFSDAGDQGGTFEGTVTADAAGDWAFDKAGALGGPHVTATATDGQGNEGEGGDVDRRPVNPTSHLSCPDAPNEATGVGAVRCCRATPIAANGNVPGLPHGEDPADQPPQPGAGRATDRADHREGGPPHRPHRLLRGDRP